MNQREVKSCGAMASFVYYSMTPGHEQMAITCINAHWTTKITAHSHFKLTSYHESVKVKQVTYVFFCNRYLFLYFFFLYLFMVEYRFGKTL